MTASLLTAMLLSTTSAYMLSNAPPRVGQVARGQVARAHGPMLSTPEWEPELAPGIEPEPSLSPETPRAEESAPSKEVSFGERVEQELARPGASEFYTQVGLLTVALFAFLGASNFLLTDDFWLTPP